MHNPDVKIVVEVHQDAAYIMTDRVQGAGGYPVGVGDCLPTCPADAISFVTREAPAYDAAAVEAAKLEKAAKTTNEAKPAAATSSIISGLKLTDAPVHTGCPGSRAQSFTQSPPQHGTIMRTRWMLLISFDVKISVSFSL